MDKISAEFTRRKFLGVASTALAASAAAAAQSQESHKAVRSPDHSQPNEKEPGPNNTALEGENPNSVWPPETDNGTVKPFKYSFTLARKRIESGGWTRQ